MAISKERRTQLIADYRRDEQDTGSPEIQIALLTARILELTEHMKLNKQDHASRRGLLRMVNQRTSLLGYLRTTERKRYQTVIERLGLRK